MEVSETVDVLIVDDNRTERFWEEKVMLGMGCHVETARDGTEALKFLLQKGKADLILLDWAMPRMSGHDFLQEIRKNSDMRHIKIMVLSGMSEDEVITCLKEGADDYWIKGSSTFVLKKRVQNVVHTLLLEKKLRAISEIAKLI